MEDEIKDDYSDFSEDKKPSNKSDTSKTLMEMIQTW